MRRFLRTLVSVTEIERSSGRPWASFPHPKNFLEKVQKWGEGLSENASFTPGEIDAIKAVKDKIAEFVAARGGQYPHYDFTKTEVDEFLDLLRSAHAKFGGSDLDALPIDADVPRSFTGDQLLRSVEANAEVLNVSEYVETMLMRIRTMLSDSRMKSVAGSADAVSLDVWLAEYIGGNQASNGSITVIDLSLVPAEAVHLITAVVARMTLEALQRYRKLSGGSTLPTVLVMEEAHVFVRRYTEDAETQNSAAICCQVFEKIAREGRKFGLGLVVSSQRPSELSPTVLSQCNSYLLHRISNDRDQQLVHRFVPDNLRGLLRDLPSLPSRSAILMGWASELPVLLQIDSLAEAHRPKSDDPDFWAVWSGNRIDEDGSLVAVDRDVDWKSIANDWQQVAASPGVAGDDEDGSGK